jgi:hypothetical protein
MAVIIAAKSSFRSRTFSTPTPHFTHGRTTSRSANSASPSNVSSRRYVVAPTIFMQELRRICDRRPGPDRSEGRSGRSRRRAGRVHTAGGRALNVISILFGERKRGALRLPVLILLCNWLEADPQRKLPESALVVVAAQSGRAKATL